MPYPYNFPEPAKEPKRGGQLTVGWHINTARQDPALSASGGAIAIPNITCNRLLGLRQGVDHDPFTNHLEPELAESWEMSSDGLEYTFNLVQGVRFHNVAPTLGRAFVAEDVKLAFERYASEGVHTSYWGNVDAFTAVNDTTFKIRMKTPEPDFVWATALRSATIYPMELVDQGLIADHAVGTGPMILKELSPGQRVVFERNPDYWQRDVLLDGMELRIILDAAARLAAFRAGQVDYANFVSTPSEAEALLGTNPDTQLNINPILRGTFALALNLADARFADPRVRQAMMLAMDREAIVDIVFEGVSKVLPLTPWPYLFDSEPAGADLGRWWKHDPTEAKRLLQAAGQEQLAFEVIYFPYNPSTNTRQNEVLADQFRQVGITLRPRQLEITEFNGQYGQRNYPEAADGWPIHGFTASEFFYGHLHSKSPGNRYNINDPQIDEWAEQQRSELNADTRRELQRRIWDRELEMAYRIPKADGPFFHTYQPWARGLRFGGSPGFSPSTDWGGQIAEVWLDK